MTYPDISAHPIQEMNVRLHRVDKTYLSTRPDPQTHKQNNLSVKPFSLSPATRSPRHDTLSPQNYDFAAAAAATGEGCPWELVNYGWTHRPLSPGAEVEFVEFADLAMEHCLVRLRTAMRYQLCCARWMRNGEGCVLLLPRREVNLETWNYRTKGKCKYLQFTTSAGSETCTQVILQYSMSK
jgi:hypothetical protein